MTPQRLKAGADWHLRATIEARKDSLSRSLTDVNALLFQIRSEMAATAVNPTPEDRFNEREFQMDSHLTEVLHAACRREWDRGIEVMEGLDLKRIAQFWNQTEPQ